MKVSRRSIFGRHAPGSPRQRSASHDAFSGGTPTGSTVRISGSPDAPPPRHSPPSTPGIPRPYSAMAAGQFPASLPRAPLFRGSTSSVLSQQMLVTPLSPAAKSRQDLHPGHGELSPRDGGVSRTESPGRNGSSPNRSPSPALSKLFKPSSATSVPLGLHQGKPTSKTPSSPPLPRQQQHQYENHSPQLQQQLKMSSPPPSQPPPLTDTLPQSDDAVTADPTPPSPERGDVQPTVSAVHRRHHTLLYILKIAVLLVAIEIALVIRLSLFIGKIASALYRAVRRVVALIAVQSSTMIRYTHIRWRGSLLTALTMADRFEDRALKQPNRRPRSQSPSPKVQISPARTISGDLKSCEGDSIASGDTELPRAQISFNLEGAVLPKVPGQVSQLPTNRSKTFILPNLKKEESSLSACVT